MKLNPPQNGQSSPDANAASSQSSTKTGAKAAAHGSVGAPNANPQAKAVGSDALSDIKNTPAKVVSSQPLSPKQAQQQLARLSEQLQQQTNKPADQSMLRQTSHLIGYLQSRTGQSQAQSQVFSTQLQTQSTLISVLTNKAYPVGSNVLINQNSSGQWQLQSMNNSDSTVQLEKWLAQLKMGSLAKPSPLKLDEGQLPTPPSASNGKSAVTVQKLSVPLDSLAFQQLDPKQKLTTLQTGIKHSGHLLERQLLQWAQQQLPKAQQSLSQNHSQGSHQDTGPNLQRGMQQVHKQMQSWVQQAQQILSKQTIAQPGNQASMPDAKKADILNSTSTNQSINSKLGLSPEAFASLIKVVQADGKGQLLLQQSQLLQKLTQVISEQPQLFKSSAIPNWSQPGSDASTSKSPLNDWFSLMLAPKSNSSISVWPQNLSVQQQLVSTVQLMLGQLPDDAPDEQALLRQLLSTSQTLSKTQHDQIQSRVFQGPGESSLLQMNLPYLHQQTLSWCELEIEQKQGADSEVNEKAQGWHLVLRFAQSQTDSFAIEAHIVNSKLELTLWSSHKSRLQTLQNHIAFLRDKLTDAGFQVQQLQTRHGEPAKHEFAISQSLVDVHT